MVCLEERLGWGGQVGETQRVGRRRLKWRLNNEKIVHLGHLRLNNSFNSRTWKTPNMVRVGSSLNVSSHPCARNEKLRQRNKWEGGARMEVQAQHSGGKGWQVAGKAGVELARGEK